MRKKGRNKKKPFSDNLPREELILDIPEDEKTCPHDGTKLKSIGEDRVEKLKSFPSRSVIVTEIKKKYSCPHCEQHVARALSNSILPKTIATPELLSYIIFSKFFQSLPLYRLEELYKLNGIDLKRGTMARWLVQVKDKLIPIWNLLEEKAMESKYMAIDATYVQVLKEPGRKAQTKSFMWARGSPEKGIVLLDYHQSGGGESAKTLMTGFSGALQGDAHRGYRKLNKLDLFFLGCMMHSRRRFNYAFQEVKKTPGLAHETLKMFQAIYRKEDKYKIDGLSPAERFERRQLEVAPLIAELKKWCESHLNSVLKTSTLGNAFHYFVNEYDELSAFLRDGRYEIDNGWIERIIKRFAVGRKNWMFCDTVEGAHTSSLLYSLTLTAKLNGKDPFKVMTEIFYKLPHAKTVDDYEAITQLLLSPEYSNSIRKKEGAIIH